MEALIEKDVALHTSPFSSAMQFTPQSPPARMAYRQLVATAVYALICTWDFRFGSKRESFPWFLLVMVMF